MVSAPGLGDEIQAIKRGILEIADIHVLSKCDRSDTNRTLKGLKTAMILGLATTAKPAGLVPILGTSSVTGEGLDELVDAIVRHRDLAFDTKIGAARGFLENWRASLKWKRLAAYESFAGRSIGIGMASPPIANPRTRSRSASSKDAATRSASSNAAPMDCATRNTCD